MDNTRQQREQFATHPDSPATSQLSQFILGQLNEKRTNGELVTRNGFVVPKLQLGSQPANKFVLPLLKRGTESTTAVKTAITPQLPPIQLPALQLDSVSRLSHSVDNLKLSTVCVGSNTQAIDLTAALTTASVVPPPTRSKQPPAVEVFAIPFIECDRQPKATILPKMNEYCQPIVDASRLRARQCLAAPSPCGRILCLRYRHTHPLPRINHSFKVKHKIKSFSFDTKSPDDIVLATINKFTRLQ